MHTAHYLAMAPQLMLSQAVISYKWTAWARRLLYAEFAAYLLWLLCFQAFTLLFQVGPCLKMLVNSL